MTTTEQATDEQANAVAGRRRTGPGGNRDRHVDESPASTTASSRRAYERRQRRTQKITASRLVGPGKPVKSALNRAPFVVVLIALLAGGIAGVLYLNTVTDEAGMRSSTAKSKAIDLRLTIESLQRDVAILDSTPRIAAEASALGMVPAGDSAMLMVDGSGAGSVVGDPTVVPGPAAPAPAPDPAADALAAQAAAQAAAAAAAAAAAPPVDPAATPADPAAAAAAAAQPVDPAAQAAADAAAAAAAAQAATDAAAAQAAADAAAAAAAAAPASPVDPTTPAQGAQQ